MSRPKSQFNVPEMMLTKDSFPVSKLPEHAMIFQCDVCLTQRMYGRVFQKPENTNPFLVCHGGHASRVNEHFPHTFLGIWVGGAMRTPKEIKI